MKTIKLHFEYADLFNPEYGLDVEWTIEREIFGSDTLIGTTDVDIFIGQWDGATVHIYDEADNEHRYNITSSLALPVSKLWALVEAKIGEIQEAFK